MQNQNFLIGILIIVVIAVAGAGGVLILTKDKDNKEAASSTNTTNDTTNDNDDNNSAAGTNLAGSDNSNDSDADLDGEEEVTATINMTSQGYSFSPGKLEIEAGKSIKVKLTNKEGTHDFVIDELGVNTGILGPGETTTFTITAPANTKGKSFEFYCSVGSHRAMGMKGTLSVK